MFNQGIVGAIASSQSSGGSDLIAPVLGTVISNSNALYYPISNVGSLDGDGVICAWAKSAYPDDFNSVNPAPNLSDTNVSGVYAQTIAQVQAFSGYFAVSSGSNLDLGTVYYMKFASWQQSGTYVAGNAINYSDSVSKSDTTTF